MFRHYRDHGKPFLEALQRDIRDTQAINSAAAILARAEAAEDTVQKLDKELEAFDEMLANFRFSDDFTFDRMSRFEKRRDEKRKFRDQVYESLITLKEQVNVTVGKQLNNYGDLRVGTAADKPVENVGELLASFEEQVGD